MSYETGTASNYLDFLDKLDAFLCNHGHAWGKTYSGTGDGTISGYIGTATSVAEMFTITATNATTFSVVGSVSGALANATVGTPYTSAKINFTITAGGTAFVAGDVFTLQTTPAWSRLRYTGCVGEGYRSGANWNASYPVTRVFDGLSLSTANVAYSTSSPAYINIELFKSDQIAKFALLNGDSTTVTVKDVALQWSDNGSAWNTLQSWTGLTWIQTYERKGFTVTSPVSHRYWRLELTCQAGQTTVRVGEVELYNSMTAQYQLENRFEFMWKAPGLDGAKDIYVGGYTYQVPGSNIHNLVFTGSRYWDATLAVTAQQNPSGIRCLPLNDQSFTYHFFANGQRAIVVATPGGSWESAYFGFGLQYETPTIHPFPMIVGACSGVESQLIADTDADHRAFWNPGGSGTAGYALAAYYPDNVWRQHANRIQSSGTSDGTGSGGTYGYSYPWATTDSGALLSDIRDQIDGGFPLIPGMLLHVFNGVVHAWGEFDGLYFVPGFNNSAGTLISYGGFDHLVIKNIARTDTHNFAAIRID